MPFQIHTKMCFMIKRLSVYISKITLDIDDLWRLECQKCMKSITRVKWILDLNIRISFLILFITSILVLWSTQLIVNILLYIQSSKASKFFIMYFLWVPIRPLTEEQNIPKSGPFSFSTLSFLYSHIELSFVSTDFCLIHSWAFVFYLLTIINFVVCNLRLNRGDLANVSLTSFWHL